MIVKNKNNHLSSDKVIAMKSIMEQASSIIKAIEKAWDRAEKPKEFSIKIFEKEEKNFFGMTTKPAKIGIFFEDKATHEKPVGARPEVTQQRPEKKELHQKQPPTQKPQFRSVKTKNEPQKSSKPIPPVKKEQSIATETPKTSSVHSDPSASSGVNAVEGRNSVASSWNDELISTTKTWLKKTLSFMGMENIDFTQEIAGKILKLTFNEPLIADVMQEKMLFRSFAHLIMASLRNQYKQEIKNLKVVLIRPE